MKKKVTLVSMLLIFSLLTTACSWSDFTSKLPWGSKNKDGYNAEDHIKMGDYKGIEVDVKVPDEEVQQQLDSLLASKETTKDVKNRNAKIGDTVVVDYSGSINKKKFDKGTAKDQSIELGSGAMIPGFDEGIVGMKKGQTKNVNVTFPNPYENNPDLAGKKAVFKIKVKSISEKIKPELTDKFIADNSDYKTIAEFKEGTKKSMVQSKKEGVNVTAMQNLLQGVELIDPPASLLESNRTHYDAYMKASIKNYGMDFDTFLTQYQMTEADYNQKLDEIAKELTKNYLVVRIIADKEGIKITEEDKKAKIEKLYEMFNIQDKKEEELEKVVKENYASTLDEYVTDSIYEDKVSEIVGKNAKLIE